MYLSRYLRLTLISRLGVLYPIHITIYGLGSSDFARHYFRNRFYFLFLRVIRWFSSPGSPRMTIDSSYDSTTLLVLSFLIRTSTDQGSFATPRSFSQLVTSFFGAMYQGILHTLFVAYSLLIAFSQSVEFICSRYLYVSKILDLSMCFHINLIFLGLFKVYFFLFFYLCLLYFIVTLFFLI